MLRETSADEIQKLLAHPEHITSLLEEKAGFIDLDKAWHGIHFLLTSSAWGGSEPLCYLIKGGRHIGDVDVGYGPARVLTPAEVRSFNLALSAITRDVLASRFDRAEMMRQKIYPERWYREPKEDDALGYLLEPFEILKSFVCQIAENGLGIITYLC
ncbi:MAG TPA: YfbM family protein [Blastocatellia bacterium]|nr:YfbM family protein [Blastocatellia bacterium]